MDAIFETEHIAFVRVTEALLPEYMIMVSDVENVLRYIGNRTEPFTLEEEKDFIREKLETGALIFSMLEKDGGGFIGNIELMDVRDSAAELGIAITAKKQNMGYGREAVAGIADFGFGHLGLRRIFLKVYPDNLRAIRVYTFCGFREYERTEEDVYMEIYPENAGGRAGRKTRPVRE